MYEARAKALELAVIIFAREGGTAERVLEVAELFREWLDPPAPASTQPQVSPADGDDYPRIQIESPVADQRRHPPPAPPNIQPV